MEVIEFGVLLFPSARATLRAEKTLIAAGVEVKLIPKPRQLSSDCGIALRFPWAEASNVKQALQLAGIDFDIIQPTQR